MIPILFDSTATTFNTNGIGRLSDAISCVVTEERNGPYDLEMVYASNGIHYHDIKHSRIIVCKPNKAQDRQAFRIYHITKPINNRVTILAHHLSYDLNQIPVMPFTATGITSALNGIKQNSVESNVFTFSTDSPNTDTFFALTKPKSARGCLGGDEESILATFSGSSGIEYLWDNYNVSALLHRGANNGVVLRYGKNITDLKQEENIDQTITGVLPFWVDPETDVALIGDVQYSPYVNNYPMRRTISLDCSEHFETAPTKEQLNAFAFSYVQTQGIPDVNISVSFVELSRTDEYKQMASLESVNLCDEVAVYFEKLGISTTAKVIRCVWDVLADKYRSIQIGNPRSNLASTLAQTITTTQNTSNKMIAVDIRVDKAMGIISSVVEQVDENMTNISSLEQTATDISLSVSEVNENLEKQQTTFQVKSDGAYIQQGSDGDYAKFTAKGMDIYSNSNKIAEATADTFKAPSFTTTNWTMREEDDGKVFNIFRGDL